MSSRLDLLIAHWTRRIVKPTQPFRPRGVSLVLSLLTIALGLGSRRFGDQLPGLIATYAGDALWAALVFWLLSVARPRARTIVLFAASATIAFLVEIRQLYHAPWLDALRRTTPGALVLGQGFLWSDLVSYLVGAGGAAVIDRWRTTRLVAEPAPDS
jgi:hypothetical protein